MARQSTIKREILERYTYDDTILIIKRYLSFGRNDVASYIKVYELFVFENLSMSQIATQFKVTATTISNKIDRIISLLQRNSITTLPTGTDILSIPIERLIISERAYSCLKSAGFKTIGDIISLCESEVLSNSNLGRKTFIVIKSALQNLIPEPTENWEDLRRYYHSGIL